jgi:uncharacterized RDD family membrane protein YckC
MSYCQECGAENDPGSEFCQRCGTQLKRTGEVLELASWGSRFIAYIIDILILGAVLGLLRLPRYLSIPGVPDWVPLLDLGVDNLVYFLYFTFMDYSYGQSIGKMALKLKIQQIRGTGINVTQAAIEAFGKAFLLPLDLIIGLILYSDKNQRLFNYLSNTVVVRQKRR